MKFKDYPFKPELQRAIDEAGYNRPTDIQFKAIQHILNGEDVMAVAQTGTGKTAAFVLPILHKLQTQKYKKALRVLVMVPTRELAKQIEGVFFSLGKYTNVKALALIGGVEQDSQINTLKNNIDVLICTPGRMFDLIAQGFIDLSQIQTWVLDEADLMLDFGFSQDIKDVQKKLPIKKQTLFFTATITKKIKSLAYDVVRNAIRIQISPKNPVSKNVSHAVLFVEMDDKRFFLENMLTEYTEARFIIFVRTKVRSERVKAAMARVSLSSEILNGSMPQEERFAVLERFKNSENKVLITTDVACRGIDIPNVDYVLNYDLPDNPENYVHRCGRTGRGTSKGQALSFCSETEKKLLEDIEQYVGEEIERFDLSVSEYKEILEDRLDPDENWKKLIEENDSEDWD